MIYTPHLWLPDRLRERREDERLLRGRGGMSRRWMPGYPCCCDTCTACKGTTPNALSVSISGLTSDNCDRYNGTWIPNYDGCGEMYGILAPISYPSGLAGTYGFDPETAWYLYADGEIGWDATVTCGVAVTWSKDSERRGIVCHFRAGFAPWACCDPVPRELAFGFTEDAEEPFVCRDFDGMALPQVTYSFEGDRDCPDANDATCSISA